jgi:hypothetical protein
LVGGLGEQYKTSGGPSRLSGKVTVTKPLNWLCTESNHQATRESTLEMLSMVYKGTATPWDQGPRAVYKGVLFPLVVLAPFCGQDFVLNP